LKEIALNQLPIFEPSVIQVTHPKLLPLELLSGQNPNRNISVGERYDEFVAIQKLHYRHIVEAQDKVASALRGKYFVKVF
jgi:hypothetical protein